MYFLVFTIEKFKYEQCSFIIRLIFISFLLVFLLEYIAKKLTTHSLKEHSHSSNEGKYLNPYLNHITISVEIFEYKCSFM